MWETWVQSLGWEDILEEGMATHSSILAWRIPHWQRRLEGYSLWGRRESDTTERISTAQNTTKSDNLNEMDKILGRWKIVKPTQEETEDPNRPVTRNSISNYESHHKKNPRPRWCHCWTPSHIWRTKPILDKLFQKTEKKGMLPNSFFCFCSQLLL